MPLHELQPPSIDQVKAELDRLEAHYGISTSDVVSAPSKCTQVREDDLSYWLFLVEQRTALSGDGCDHNPLKDILSSIGEPERSNASDADSDQLNLAA